MVGNEHIFMIKQTVSLQIWLAWILEEILGGKKSKQSCNIESCW